VTEQDLAWLSAHCTELVNRLLACYRLRGRAVTCELREARTLAVSVSLPYNPLQADLGRALGGLEVHTRLTFEVTL
jgi:hypothetical protein